ncbi:MAG: methyltransferase domain-containing protein [Deltaproteobacteria bacterium]|nr:MAG: methyltransferase domain-containing protein [Deltaproteobacteria bacterium]
MTTSNHWITLDVRPAPGERVRLGRRLPTILDDLAGLLGLEEGVMGVEIAGPDTWGAPTPHLVVHVAVDAAKPTEEVARAWAERLGLAVHVDATERHGDDYLDAWKAFHPPIYCGRGRNVLVRPSWTPPPAVRPEVTVVLDPGRAFGTGRHESTRLCLDWIADLPPPHPGTVLDLGCGSGVLAICAAMRFGAEVTAVDVDAEAVDATRENAAANDVAVRALVADLAGAPHGPFECVLANIRPEVLVPAAAEVVSRTAPFGRALLSGILTEEAPAVCEAYRAAGATATVVAERDGWCAIEVRPRQGSAGS